MVEFGVDVAERFREGNVFLIGDAAHRVTPRGATGLPGTLASDPSCTRRAWSSWMRRSTGDELSPEALGIEVVPGWVTFTGALQTTRDALLAADPTSRARVPGFFVLGEPPELVGWGGFNGPPRGGVVELGYEIAESRWGQGLATAATRAPWLLKRSRPRGQRSDRPHPA